MISCSIVGLLCIFHDSMVINGLSNCAHMKCASRGAQTITTYMKELVTNESKSHPFVRGFWQYAWWHCLSRSERDAYPLVSLSFVACVIENFRE